MLAGQRVELNGLPDERVVHSETVRPWRNGAGSGIAEEQRGKRRTVERNNNLADAHVGRVAAFHRQRRVLITGFLPHTR